MKKILFLAGCIVTAMYAHTQNIISAEAFVDADPGTGKATALSIGAGGSVVNFTKNISTSGLQTGFHFLGVRVKNSAGLWSLPEKRGFYISVAATNTGNITAAEFFIDVDPGTGKGSALSIGTAGSNVQFTANISSGLPIEGFHILCIRTKSAQGVWNVFEKRGFFVSANAVSAPDIKAAEFFVDADPGTGKGTGLSIGTSGSNVQFIANISSGSLTEGFHTLCIRTKNTQDVWSIFEKRGFFVSANAVNAPDIKAAEFFVDADPGTGKGTVINIGAAAGTVNFIVDIPTKNLNNGFHLLGIRVKNTPGTWSLIEKRGFFISTLSDNTPLITAGEFFIDTDPGIGNAQPVNIDAGADVTKTFTFTLPDGLEDGDHFIGIRFKDANGRWSISDFDTVNIDGSLPLQLLSFTGTHIGNINKLQWITTNEINTAYFEIERSGNGISFEKIGIVNAVNISHTRNVYTFNDETHFSGYNFYRLKQFDKDGSYSYSNIIRITADNNNDKFLITPNPASSIINIYFNSTGNKLLVNIYDANGRMVIVKSVQTGASLTVNVEHLAAGKYFVQVSDGLVQKRGAFIKQ